MSLKTRLNQLEKKAGNEEKKILVVYQDDNDPDLFRDGQGNEYRQPFDKDYDDYLVIIVCYENEP